MARDNGLDAALRQRFATALAEGNLQPIETQATTITDRGIEFAVRYLANQSEKPREAHGDAPSKDPFLPPYEPSLSVAPIEPAHMGLLNKFPVIRNHLLIVTKRHQPQTALLDRTDFEALLTTLAAIDGLGFYNGGEQAGASQPHKHLQLVPLPLTDAGPPFPLAPLLDQSAREPDILQSIPPLGFKHRATPVDDRWWQNPATGAHRAHALYRQMLEALGIGAVAGDQQSAPYNLLMTRRWMWLVARTTGEYRGIPVNGLGYAGALMVQRREDIDTLKKLGPLTLLARTGVLE